MRAMPELRTERLVIRPLTLDDVTAVYHIHKSIGWANPEQNITEQLDAVLDYVLWSSLNHAQLAQLDQPPYGDRAVVLQAGGEIIGTCGLVPCIDTFGVFPYFGGQPDSLACAEMGLMWAIATEQQSKGYATEVARALIQYCLTDLHLHHVIATTEYDNIPSQRVMEKAGMRLERNPFPEPPWLQIMGIAAL